VNKLTLKTDVIVGFPCASSVAALIHPIELLRLILIAISISISIVIAISFGAIGGVALSADAKWVRSDHMSFELEVARLLATTNVADIRGGLMRPQMRRQVIVACKCLGALRAHKATLATMHCLVAVQVGDALEGAHASWALKGFGIIVLDVLTRYVLA